MADSEPEDCAICLCELDEAACSKIKKCGHIFHETCILDCWKGSSPSCPICRQSAGCAPQGKGPSGTMEILLTDQNCPGFSQAKTIEIRYSIPSGTQKSYHDNPGQNFSGTYRVAYLPSNLDGCVLLRRLKYAWEHGLTFAVGTSLTTHQPNVVVWTSIHHKTSLHGGTHGFPDPNYIQNCNDELDNAGVPPGSELIGSVHHEIVPYLAPDSLGSGLRHLLEPVDVGFVPAVVPPAKRHTKSATKGKNNIGTKKVRRSARNIS